MASQTQTMSRPRSHLVDCVDKRASVTVERASLEASPRMSISPPSVRISSKKPKDDIRYYFRPVQSPREDIRTYFRPVHRGSRIILDRPRPPKSRTVLPRPQYEFSLPPSPKAPKVPPKAKAKSSGEKNRNIFQAKQRQMNLPGQTAAQSNSALPGFDPVWTEDGNNPSQGPTSPRIIEVVDRSLMPRPLRTDSTRTSPTALEDDNPLHMREHLQASEQYQHTQEEYQQTTLTFKPDSVYGTLPPLPVQLARNNQPTPHSPKLQGHRRQDTPYSPDAVGRTSVYASSEVLPAPSALEAWASERRRIAHGQPATAKDKVQPCPEKEMVQTTFANSANVQTTLAKDKDKTLKKTKSVETKLFRSPKKSKAEKNERKEQKAQLRRETSEPSKCIGPSSLPFRPPLTSEDLHHPGTRWDVSSLPPSPEMVRPGMPVRARSDSGSDKMVVSELTRQHTDDSSLLTLSSTVTVKSKKPNKFIRMLEAYSKNVEGLQMVQ